MERTMKFCLECGDRIEYGRTDKVFCSTRCRTEYHNTRHKTNSSWVSLSQRMLVRNYRALQTILSMGRTGATMEELRCLGFDKKFVTFHQKVKGHDEYGVWELRFNLTPKRISMLRIMPAPSSDL